VLRGEHAWLEHGIVGLTPADPIAATATETPAARTSATHEPLGV
jgi:hypothetical protein